MLGRRSEDLPLRMAARNRPNNSDCARGEDAVGKASDSSLGRWERVEAWERALLSCCSEMVARDGKSFCGSLGEGHVELDVLFL